MAKEILGIGIVVAIAATLSGCSQRPEIESALKEHLLDPFSAQFRDLAISTDGNSACISWIARNRMGGYGGWKVATFKKSDDKWSIDIFEEPSLSCSKTELDIRIARATAVKALESMATGLSAQATEYNQVQADKSGVAFVYQQMGILVDGRFKKFSSQLSFDPAKPTAAKTSFDVELASVDTGAQEGDDEVAGKQWFNTKAFPTARFISSSVKHLGYNRYEVTGQLSIKGKTQDVVVPATFSAQGNTGVFEGAFTIRRADFSIGEDSWAKFDIVANDVRIKFRITASGN